MHTSQAIPLLSCLGRDSNQQAPDLVWHCTNHQDNSATNCSPATNRCPATKAAGLANETEYRRQCLLIIFSWKRSSLMLFRSVSVYMSLSVPFSHDPSSSLFNIPPKITHSFPPKTQHIPNSRIACHSTGIHQHYYMYIHGYIYTHSTGAKRSKRGRRMYG